MSTMVGFLLGLAVASFFVYTVWMVVEIRRIDRQYPPRKQERPKPLRLCFWCGKEAPRLQAFDVPEPPGEKKWTCRTCEDHVTNAWIEYEKRSKKA